MQCREIPFRHYGKITDSLMHTAKVHPDLPFLKRREGERFETSTYQAVLDRVRRIGDYLKKQGLVAGDRAAVLGHNSPEWILCYLGILWAGGVVVPLDARATVTEWVHLMNHSPDVGSCNRRSGVMG